jgi:uncharacterized protein
VRILLPPSEGKATGGYGPPVELRELSFPSLTPVRKRVLSALTALCKGPGETAMDVLELAPGLADAVAGNRLLRRAPTLTAAELYTGVLYDNLALATLDEEARKRAAERIWIFSGLWGVLGLDDRVPRYRLAMGVRLPPLGGLASVWRPALNKVLRPEGLVVDMRSAPYAAAWKVPSAGVRVVQEKIVNGVPKRSVVSHMAKATRGAVARTLVETGVDPETTAELAGVLRDLGYTAELTATGIDIVIKE